MPISKVLVANRGEIAVRVIRAAADAGLRSVAVYADPDPDALFVRLADEAYALGGATPGRDLPGHRQAARRRRAQRRRRGPPRLRVPRRERRLRPGGDRRRADLDRPAAAGDRRPRRQGRGPAHRREGRRAAGPRHGGPGGGRRRGRSRSPTEHGLPIAIKAAFGGGGRGLKVARTLEEIPELFESATREAVDRVRPRRVLRRALPGPAAARRDPVPGRPHGNVVVVSTRDCSLQRRHQKLVEEAPAPFLTDAPARPALRRLQGDPAPRPGTSAPARASSWSARTARSPSSRSTPACRSSTR